MKYKNFQKKLEEKLERQFGIGEADVEYEPFSQDFIEVDRILDVRNNRDETLDDNDSNESEKEDCDNNSDEDDNDCEYEYENESSCEKDKNEFNSSECEDSKFSKKLIKKHVIIIEKKTKKNKKKIRGKPKNFFKHRELSLSLSPNSSSLKLQYLVKWRSLPYDQSTWEDEEIVLELDKEKVEDFRKRQKIPPIIINSHSSISSSLLSGKITKTTYTTSPPFKDGRELRKYQLEGLNWLLFNWSQGRNSILADEMGLG
jgi:SNF2 family DNA or RNA helicase